MTPQQRQEREQQIIALLEQGLSVREVARRTGASYSYVRARAVRSGRDMSRGHANKEDHCPAHGRIAARAMSVPDPEHATAQTFLPQLVQQHDELRALSATLAAVLAHHLSAGGTMHDKRALDLSVVRLHLDVASTSLEDARVYLALGAHDVPT